VKRGSLHERHTTMTTRPIPGLVASLAIPTIVSMLVTALYNMADTFFVGRINTSATAAVGVVFPLMTSIQVIGITLGVGSGSFIARLLGQKDSKRANRATSTAFFTALAVGALYTVGGELLLTPLMRLLGSTESILPYASGYARVVLFGAPFMAAAFVMNVNLRSEGSAVLSMIGLASGAILNIALDPLFIFTFRMGIAGAAAATILSQFVSFCILLSHYLSRRSTLAIDPKNFSPKWEMYWEMLKSGLPTLFRQSFVTIAVITLNLAARPFGDAALAGMTVVNRIMFFIMAMLIGFGQGFQPVAAFNYTAGFHHRVYQAFRFSVAVGTIALFFCALGAGVFAPFIIAIFRNDIEVIQIGSLALRLQCVTLPLSPYIVISNMMFQYIGKPVRASILALARQGLVFIPVLLVFSSLFGLFGVQLSQAVADVLTFVLALPLTAGMVKTLATEEVDNGGQAV